MDRYLQRFRYMHVADDDKEDQQLDQKPTLLSFPYHATTSILLVAVLISTCIACVISAFVTLQWQQGGRQTSEFLPGLYC